MSAHRPGEIIESIIVEDVTEDKERLDIAFKMVASNYAKLSSRPLDVHEVYTELCRDIYHEKGLARTLLASGIDPLTGEQGPVGTIRVVISPQQGMNGDISPLEAMSLISPPEGWGCFQSRKFDPFKCAEIGRFVMRNMTTTGSRVTRSFTSLHCA